MTKIKKYFEFVENKDTLYIFDFDDTLVESPDFEELAIEYLKSDVWLYPTDFLETYCITAVEAQMAGCLCATVGIGSLEEIVGERGILVVGGDINKEETVNKLLGELYKVLDNKEVKANILKKAKECSDDEMLPFAYVLGINLNQSLNTVRKDFIMRAKKMHEFEKRS
jgi:glycosyltransferase involved in cell wall biosynthesis